MKSHQLFELDELIVLVKDRQIKAFHNMVEVRGTIHGDKGTKLPLGYGRSQEIPPA